jgi:hypothetical protein
MDPKRPPGEMWLAPPPPSSSGALRLPARDAPPLDEHLVQPETTRDQLVRGRKVIAMPSLPPHGDRHFKLDYVIGAHVQEGYVGSTDLLTRSAETSDFATDTCIRKAGIDPRTGQRYLEELAFEIVNEQSLRDITEQAEDLTARGVRRLIAIFVKKGEAREWSPQTATWKKLDPESTIADPTLARPIRVKELLDAAEADNAVVHALDAKGNPALQKLREESLHKGLEKGLEKGIEQGLEQGRQEGRREGRDEGRREGLVQGIELACSVLGIDLTEERRGELASLDVAGLEARMARLQAERRW